MTDPLTFESNAVKAERIAAALGASELFNATLSSPNGNVSLGAPQQTPDGPETGAQQPTAQALTSTPGEAPEGRQRHVVGGLGNVPPAPEHAVESPYEHLAALLSGPAAN